MVARSKRVQKQNITRAQAKKKGIRVGLDLDYLDARKKRQQNKKKNKNNKKKKKKKTVQQPPNQLEPNQPEPKPESEKPEEEEEKEKVLKAYEENKSKEIAKVQKKLKKANKSYLQQIKDLWSSYFRGKKLKPLVQKKEGPLNQTQPNFLKRINGKIETDFGKLSVSCGGGSKKKGSRIKNSDGAFGYVKLVSFLTKTVSNLRLAVLYRTGSGKTLTILKSLSSLYKDRRPKILIFPNASVQRNFYEELCEWSNPYLDYVITKIGPVQYTDEGDIKQSWYTKMVDILRMKGRLRRAGKEGELAAPLRCYTYSTALSARVMRGEDPLFRRKTGENPYSNKIIALDEAHNLLQYKKIKHPIAKMNMKKLGPVLMACRNSVFLAVTATPIVQNQIEGEMLLRIVKGGNPKLANSHYIVQFDSMPQPLYPKVSVNLKNTLLVMPIYLQGFSLLHLLTKKDEKRSIRDMNMVTNDFHMLKKYGSIIKEPGKVQQMMQYAQKLVTIAMMLKKKKERCLVMIDRSQGIQVVHQVLESVLGMRVGLLFNSSRDKKKGKQYCQEKTAKELGWFNKDPEAVKVIVADTQEFSEGVSFTDAIWYCEPFFIQPAEANLCRYLEVAEATVRNQYICLYGIEEHRWLTGWRCSSAT